MREKHRDILGQQSSSINALRLLDVLFENKLKCAYVTANKLVEQFQQLGLLKEITGWQRNRLYRYEPYLKLFDN